MGVLLNKIKKEPSSKPWYESDSLKEVEGGFLEANGALISNSSPEPFSSICIHNFTYHSYDTLIGSERFCLVGIIFRKELKKPVHRTSLRISQLLFHSLSKIASALVAGISIHQRYQSLNITVQQISLFLEYSSSSSCISIVLFSPSYLAFSASRTLLHLNLSLDCMRHLKILSEIKKKIQHDVGGSIPIVFEETGAPDFVGNTIGFDVTWVENGRQVSITEGKVVEVQTSSGKSTSYWKVELGVVPQAVHVVEPEAGHAGMPGISINGSPVSNAKPGRTDTHK
ncbi:hypothetical protein LENED_009278 [Lentinula edodes]|uniref:Uncharacterized protein n=1 Tax=Lentinula edodes TaxID=5353 RepID=A0A1Q3EJF7_LENED|nr:hypothetical protein LENED_009278 [Lentinula edodes]